MTWQAWTQVAAILAGGMALFASEKLRYDVIALLMLMLLLVLGIVTPAEGLSGFSATKRTVVIAAMFALNAGVVGTGAISNRSRSACWWQGSGDRGYCSCSIMLLMAALGAFIKNTALVATFLPVALTVCARTKTAPSRVLMPMSFAAQMGGVSTLIGTSSNQLANSLAKQQGLHGFSVFEFAKLGAVLAMVGIAYMMLIGRWLLPTKTDTKMVESVVQGKYVTELRVRAGRRR